ncbi:YcxB family protein, partial [Bifidobacterium sp. UMB6791A]|nr:YcxB family protein [Bifidobacterium sp. UMB6791A]
YLQYNRDSQDGKCGLYILFKASKSSDGSWSPSDADMQNTYTYEYSTGLIAKSSRAYW